MLKDTKINATAVLYSSSEATEYLDFVQEMKSESTHLEWNAILSKLESDIQLYKDLTIADIEKSLK